MIPNNNTIKIRQEKIKNFTTKADDWIRNPTIIYLIKISMRIKILYNKIIICKMLLVA